jgi:XTP/dITP diphosphohydrolase
MAALADDTGLEVDALAGAPGVRSARYAGEGATYEENVAKLLDELEKAGAVDESDRGARFRTVVVICFPDGDEIMAEGVVEGSIIPERRGKGGFGYDPVFVPEGHERTFAEMEPQEKHALSHRGRALSALALELPA